MYPFVPGWRTSNQAAMANSGGGATAQSIVTALTGDKYITTTWTHTPTDGTKVTIAYWEKLIGAPVNTSYSFTTAASSGALFDHYLNGASQHYVVQDDVGSAYNVNDNIGPTPDTNWHHICIQIDTTQVTAGNRVTFWIDGVNAGSIGTSPTLNSNMQITANTIASYIGIVSYQIGGGHTTDAKWAYIYLIDGQALPPTTFRNVGGHPVAYGGTYGNNGFFLNGSGSTLNDQSGNGNNWTAPNGISFDVDIPS